MPAHVCVMPCHTVRMSDFKFHFQAESSGTSHVYATLDKYKASKYANLAVQCIVFKCTRFCYLRRVVPLMFITAVMLSPPFFCSHLSIFWWLQSRFAEFLPLLSLSRSIHFSHLASFLTYNQLVWLKWAADYGVFWVRVFMCLLVLCIFFQLTAAIVVVVSANSLLVEVF